MAKAVPFFTYVLDLAELYLWCNTEGRQKARPLEPRPGGLWQRTGALTAGDVQEGAVHGGHPQVGGARVEHHGEGLRRRSQADLTVILGLVNDKKNTVFPRL